MIGEIRIPNKLLSSALSDKKVKALRLLSAAKLHGHRVEINQLFHETRTSPKTGKRTIDILINSGWAGSDGKFLFPRSWRRLQLNKRGGLYISTTPKDMKKFEALCFAKALKKTYRKKGSPHSIRRRIKQEDFPTGYLCAAMGLKETRFKTLKARAQRYRFISVKAQVRIIGKAKDYAALRKNLPGLPLFKRGKHTVVPAISKIKILI